MQQAGNRDLLKQAVTEIKNKYLTRENIKAKIDSYRAITEPLVTAKPDDYWDIYENDAQKIEHYDAALNKLVDNVENNYSRFILTFDNPMPFYAYVPEITADTTQTKSVRFDWDDTVSLQGNTINYDLVLYNAKSVEIPNQSTGSPSHVIVPGEVVEIKKGIQVSDLTLNWVHPAGTYFYKVIARDTTKPSILWQVSYDEAVKDVNGFPLHGVIKFEVLKAGVGVAPVITNNAPIAYDQSIAALPRNTSTEISLIASDVVERSRMTATIVRQASKGTVTLNADAMTVNYKPNLNATGTDSFTFKVNDGLADSNHATVSLLINEVPVAKDQVRAAVKKNSRITINLANNVSNAEGDTLILLISKKPQHGILSAVNGLKVVYTPDKHYAGVDSFSYRVKDARGLYSDVAKVTMTLLNKAPTVKTNQEVKLIQDTKKLILLSAKDADNDTLTLKITKKPLHGSLNKGSGLAVTYSPDKNYVGSDSFSYRVSDATVDSNEATVRLTVAKKAVPITEKSTGGGSISWFLFLIGVYGLRLKKRCE